MHDRAGAVEIVVRVLEQLVVLLQLLQHLNVDPTSLELRDLALQLVEPTTP